MHLDRRAFFGAIATVAVGPILPALPASRAHRQWWDDEDLVRRLRELQWQRLARAVYPPIVLNVERSEVAIAPGLVLERWTKVDRER